jgi:hypothetical protein
MPEFYPMMMWRDIALWKTALLPIRDQFGPG